MDFSVIQKYRHSIKGDSKRLVFQCKIVLEGIHKDLSLSSETFTLSL